MTDIFTTMQAVVCISILFGTIAPSSFSLWLNSIVVVMFEIKVKLKNCDTTTMISNNLRSHIVKVLRISEASALPSLTLEALGFLAIVSV